MGVPLLAPIDGRAIATPATPASGYGRLFYNTATKHWCSVDDAGVLTDLAASAAPALSTYEAALDGAVPAFASFTALAASLSPLGWWRLGEAASPSADSGSGGNALTAAGGVTYSQAGGLVGDANTAVLLNGTTGTLDGGVTGLGVGNGPFSWFVRFKTTVTGANACLLDHNCIQGGSANGMALSMGNLANGKLSVVDGTNRVISSGSTLYNDGNWHTCVVTKNASNVWHMYGDGIDVTVADAFPSQSTSNGPGTHLRIGTQYNAATPRWFFPGTIDEPMIIGSELTPAQALALHNATLGVFASTGGLPAKAGKFDITGLSGLTAGKPVLISKAAGPYTGKGNLADEAEMDLVVATGYVVDAATVRVYWQAVTPQIGNVKFNYLIGA